ncbi:transglutaminaseTgpA domain-containing protein [Planctomycetota bacterium]|nr:transglutaminaseTgpA domain-containing protein [Planctomycetota bacterium]
MLNPAKREAAYQSLARLTGLALVITCVVFQRRGLMDWSEVLFLVLCVGIQEGYIRGGNLRRVRTPLLVTYSFLPLALTVYHATEISGHGDNFVNVILLTPLPLVLTSVQIMVLYVRESARLISVVLVLCLFSVVIGLRRTIQDAVWVWVLSICALAALYLLLQYPSLLYQGVYRTRKPGHVPPSGQPGGLLRGLFAAFVPVILLAVLLSSVSLYFFLPRVDLSSTPDPTISTTSPSERRRGGRDDDDDRRRGGGGNSGRQNNGGISGMSDGVDLGEFGKIKLDESIAVVVEELSPRQTPPPLYMRAFTFATFDGERWTALDDLRYRKTIPYQERRRLSHSSDSRDLGVDIREFMVTPEKPSLGMDGQMPLPPTALFLREYAGPLTHDWMQGTLRTNFSNSPRGYIVTANIPDLTGARVERVLRGLDQGEGFDPAYKVVPASLAAQIKSQFKPYDHFKTRMSKYGAHVVCTELVRMFKNEKVKTGEKNAWEYSLERRPARGKDAIARFLNTSIGGERFGHCEYFATAMTMLLRAYGHPARVATGYVGQAQVEPGKWDLKGKNAHAWVEVHYEKVGWIRYDPTPSDNTTEGATTPEPTIADPQPQQPEPEIADPEEPEGAEATVEEPEDWFNEYDRDTQDRLFSGIADWFGRSSTKLSTALSGIMGWMPIDVHPLLKLILFFSPVGLIMLTAGILRRRKKKRVMRALEEMGITQAVQKQRGLYIELLLLLSKHGFQKRRSETPREFAERVAATQEIHQPLLALTMLYYRFRFGRAKEAEKEFKRSLSKYEASLRSLPS